MILMESCIGRFFGHVLEDEHSFYKGFVQRGASMRAAWSDKQKLITCPQNSNAKGSSQYFGYFFSLAFCGKARAVPREEMIAK